MLIWLLWLEMNGTKIGIQGDLISEPAFSTSKLDYPSVHRIF